MISELTEIGKGLMDLGSDVYSVAKENNFKARAMSIAEKARKSIFMYKVLLSAGIQNIDVASDITKYLESMYAVFTLISMGYNPVAKDNSGLSSIIKGVSAEGLNALNFKDVLDPRAYSLEMMYIGEPGKSAGPRIGKNASTEALNDKGVYVDITGNDKDLQYGDEINKNINDLKKIGTVSGDVRASDVFVRRLDQMNSNAYPTIINLSCSVGDRKDAVQIPVAVKANAYGIGTEELRLLIEAGIGGKAGSFLRKLKLRSGEIDLIEYIFKTDEAKRDKKLYESLGRNPWYRELQKRKNLGKQGFWSKVLGKRLTNNNIKNDTADKAYKDAMELVNTTTSCVPPTASLIVTKEDLVASTRLSIEHFTKNDGFIKKFMEESFLLAFGYVDMVEEKLVTFFLGYNNPFEISFSELKKRSKDPNEALYETLKNLSRKV